MSKNDELYIKNKELCIKNEEFCIKNDEFCSTNWNIPQAITISALVDVPLEGFHITSINHVVASADIAYNNLQADTVDVSITDDALIVNTTEVDVYEGSYEVIEVSVSTQTATGTMLVTLSAQQAAGMPELTISPTMLTFDPLAYTSVQRVFLYGAPEDLIDYGHSRRRMFLYLEQAPGQCETVSGTGSDAGVGEVGKLGPHEVSCQAGQALKDWRYMTNADGSLGEIERTCCTLAELEGVCTDLETTLASVRSGSPGPSGPQTGTDVALSFLASHDVDCGAGFLQKWQVAVQATGPSAEIGWFKIQYTCCAATAAMTQGTCTQRTTAETPSFTYLPLAGFVDAEGTMISQHATTDEAACMTLCTAEFTCESFGLDASSSTCRLYDAVVVADAALEDPVVTTGYVTYYKNFGTANLVAHAVSGCAPNELLSQWSFGNPTTDTAVISYTCCVWSVTADHPQRMILPVNLLSNDKAGVVVNPYGFGHSHMDFLEGGDAARFGIHLASEPLQSVSIALSYPAGTGATATPTSFSFDSTTWNVPQMFVVRGDEDDQHEGDRPAYMVVAATSTDPIYGRSTVPSATGTAWCLAGVTCPEWEPFAPVCAGTEVTHRHECAARASCDQLLYVGECDGRSLHTAGLAVVTMGIVDDDRSGVEVYTAGTLLDCDVLSPEVFQECSGNCVPRGDCAVPIFAGSEDGTTDLIVLKLTSMPRGTVVVTVTTNDADEQVKFAPKVSNTIAADDASWVMSLDLTFDTTTWTIPQTIHVGCVDDLVDEMQSHSAMVFVESSSIVDTLYNQAPRLAANVTIADNDVALVSVYAPFANTGVAEGTQSSYTLWLETKPMDDVTVTVAGSQVDVMLGSEALTGTPTPTTVLIFTPDTWSVPQEVIIQATDDFDIERTDNLLNTRNHVGTIQHTVSSTDTFYDSAGRGDTCSLPTGLPVFVNIVDNDDPRVFMSKATLAVAEGKGRQMYIVKLLGRPTSDVFFDVIFDEAALIVEPRVLTFQAAGWQPSTQAVVSVWAVDDSKEMTDTIFDIDGIQTVSVITHSVRSDDPFYGDESQRALIEPPPLPVTVTDNDFSAVLIGHDLNYIVVRENGMLSKYNVRLATQPNADVYLHISPGNLSEAVSKGHEVYVVNSSLLVFTENNWNLSQIVLVAAVDDTDEEEMCSAPTDEYGIKLPQLIRHMMITDDAKYLPGCGRDTHDCATPGTQYPTVQECEAACTAPYDLWYPAAPSEQWCGGCLRIYQPAAQDLLAGCPPALNGSLLPDRCYKYEVRQGLYYENNIFPTFEDDADEFNELMRRRNTGDYNQRYAIKQAYVVDDDSTLLSPVEKISDVSERTSVHNWAVLPNVTVYAGIPSGLIITPFDRCGKVVKTDYEARFRLTTSDRFVPSRIADGSRSPMYTVDVLAGPTTNVQTTVSLLIGGIEAQIQGSPIYLRVLAGPAHHTHSYVMGLGATSTSETAVVRIFWFDEFGSPTNLVCRPTRSHTLPIAGATSDCIIGENEHNSVFQVGFMDASGVAVSAGSFANINMFGWCDDASRPYGYTKPQCLDEEGAGSSTVVQYTSEAPGNYLLSVEIGGQPIAGSPPGRIVTPSPYPITISAGPTIIGQCYAQGTGASAARAGDQSIFLIKLADAFGNVKSPLGSDPITFECLMTSQSDASVVVGVVSPQDDGYMCVYTVQLSGSYIITVKAHSPDRDEFGVFINTVMRDISNSPMALDIKPAHPNPDYFTVKAGDGTDLAANPVTVAGALIEFQVLAMDQFLNPSTMLCNATYCETTPLPHVSRTTLLHGNQIVENVTVSAPVAGVYPIAFTPTISGTCRVEVVINGHHVPQSPFQITVLPSQLDPSKTVVEGGGVEGGVAGYTSTFTVRLVDTYRNPVQGTGATLQAGVLQSNTHCFNVTNETDIPIATDLGVQDISCTSQDERIKVPVGCSESWQNSTPACAIPVDCVGRFSAWTSCSDFVSSAANVRTCGFGTRKKHYVIDRAALNGGYECDYQAMIMWEEACAMNPCQPVTTCVDVNGATATVSGTSEDACELTGNTWAAGNGAPACASTHETACAAVTTTQADCDATAGGNAACTWDGSACAATDIAACSPESANGEVACLGAGACTYTEDGACTDAASAAVVAGTQAACERNGNVWDCSEHCQAECAPTGPGETGQPNEPAMDLECLYFFSWQALPALNPTNATNTTGPTCTAMHTDLCADATEMASCAASGGGGGACCWKSDSTCRACDAVECRTALWNIGSKNTFHPNFAVGDTMCAAAGDCTYDAGTDNITLTVLPYRQMWCQYCYEVTDASPVTALTTGSEQQFGYQVSAAGAWEIIIVMTVVLQEAFHFHKVAAILSLADADANATMSTIEGLATSVVNETFTFYLQARTAQGINLVRGGDPFEIGLATASHDNIVLDATNNDQTAIANGTETMQATFTDNGNGVYAVTLWTIAAGRYAVEPRLNDGNAVDMGSYRVDVLPEDTDPAHSVVFGRSVRYAGQEMYIDIRARDIFSNNQVYSQYKGPDPFSVSAGGPGPVALQLDDYNTGVYRTRWFATLSGLYTLNISLHNLQISESPVRVNLGPAPVSGATSTATGIGLGAGGLDADTPTAFTVQLRDAFGNRGVLDPELVHFALIGHPRVDAYFPVPAADPPTFTALDEHYRMTIETAVAHTHHLVDCDRFFMFAETQSGCVWVNHVNDITHTHPGQLTCECVDPTDACRSAGTCPDELTCDPSGVGPRAEAHLKPMNATELGVVEAYVLDNLAQWQPMDLNDGLRLTYGLQPVHGVKLVFSNATTTFTSPVTGLVTRTLPTGIHPTAGLVFSCYEPLNATLVPDDAGGDHELFYHATIAGNYKLRISYGHELITNQQYSVVVQPGEFNESTSTSSIPASDTNVTMDDAGDIIVDATWPTTIAGRDTNFSIIVRDSYSNELTGGQGLLSANLRLARPLSILKMDTRSAKGHYSFSTAPTRIGVYQLTVARMGTDMPSMLRMIVVLPAEPYGPNCIMQRNGGMRLDDPITGQVNWHQVAYPIFTSRHSYHMDIILSDRFGNAIDAAFSDTGYSVEVTASSTDPVIVSRGADSMTDQNQGQIIHVLPSNPVEIRISTLVAGPYTLNIDFVSPDNTSLPVGATPFSLLAQPNECVGAWSEFTIRRDSDFVAGEVFEIGLTVTDAFSNPCTPELLEVSAETRVSLQERQAHRLETPAETANREAREAQIVNNALQTGYIVHIDDAPILFMEPGRIQWLHNNFVRQELGHYKYIDIPTVVGQYGFEIKVNNATLWLHVSGLGKTNFELGVVGSATSRVETDTQIDALLTLVSVAIRPGPASPVRSFLSGRQNTEVDISTQFYVHTMDAFDNLVVGTFATICTKVVRVDIPATSSAPVSIFENAAPVIAHVVNAGLMSRDSCGTGGCGDMLVGANIFNITMTTTVSGVYRTHVYVFDGGPANIGRYLDCPTLLAAEVDDPHALKSKLASVCPQYNFAQLSDDGLCTSPLAYASDDTVWAQVDFNGDNILSRDEVLGDQLANKLLVQLIDTDVTIPTYTDELMAVLDSTPDGAVTFEEFYLRWKARMNLPVTMIYPGVASVVTSSAIGNGLRGGFRGDPIRFKVELRDRFGNLRSYNVHDTLEINVINVNASAMAGIWRANTDGCAPRLPCPLLSLQGRNPGLSLPPGGCEVGNCVSTLAEFDYDMFNSSSTGGQWIQAARTFRQFTAGIYSVAFTPSATDVFHVAIFINEERLSINRCDFGCSPTAVALTEELKVPTLLSVTDADDEIIRAGQSMSILVQLRNEIGYDLNFGGYMGALIIGMEPDVTLCGDIPVVCASDWLADIPFVFGVLDRADGSYRIDYTPTLPGVYNLSVMVNLTHNSLPVIPCTPGLLSCVTRFEPVCGYDLRTYPNECFAENECIGVAYRGECVYGKPIPIPWIDQPLAEYNLVVLPSGTSAQHSVVKIKEAYMCPLGTCYRLKTLRATAADPPRHVGLSTRRSYCDTPDNDLAMHRCPGQTFEFQVQALDSFGNIPEYRPREESFAGSCIGPVNVAFETRNTQENGTYFYTATLTVSGDYVISLTMNGEDLGSSSFWLALDPPHYWVADTSSVDSYATAVVAGDTEQLFLRPRGQYGNALYSQPAPGPLADGSVMLNFDPPATYTKSVASWDRINGTVAVSYQVRNSGTYTMNVSFFQLPFAMDSIDIIVIAGRAVSSQCVAHGGGLSDGIAGGVDRTVHIDTKDGFGNLVTDPVGLENFVVQIDHTDGRVFDLWGFGGGWTPLHMGERYTATLTSYSPPVYTYTYTAAPAGFYATVVSLNGPATGGTLVPYRSDHQFTFKLALATAPLIQRLQFRDTGAHIELEFDRVTNKARQPQPASCLELIDATNVAAFGTASSCRWLSASMILVTLGPGATVLVGDTIAVKPGVILAHDENSPASSSSAVLAIPANMPAPVVTLTAPTTLGQCDDLLLDASGSTGSGGRAMGYTYTALAGVGANLAAVYGVLHLASCPPLSEMPCNQAVVSADTLVAGKMYTFTVTVTNFWGATGSATVMIYKSSQPTPKVLIAGPTTKNVRSSDTVLLSSDVEVSSCYNGDAQMNFAWSLLPGSPAVTLPAQFVNSREIQIAKGQLAAGQTYRFGFRGIMAANVAYMADAEVSVVVSYSELDIEIVGGSRDAPNSRSVPVRMFVTDPEDIALASPVSYVWVCEPVAAPGTECATTQAFHNLQSTANEGLTLTPGMLPAAAYRFTVTATKDPGFRSKTTSAVINLVSDPILDVFIERQLPVGVSDGTFSSSDRLILNRKVYGAARPTTCTWSVDQASGLDLDADGVLGTTRTSIQLVVRPDYLTQPVYTFHLTCVERIQQVDDPATVVLATGSAQYTINVNTPPASGTLRLKDATTHQPALTQGINVMDAQLEISAENWVDEAAHQPLTYEFRKGHPSTPDREVVLARASSPTIIARLPAGKLEDDYQVLVVLYVSDRYGATSRTEVRIKVFPVDQAQAMVKAEELMAGGFADATKTGDVREMLQLCTIVGEMISIVGGSGRRLQEDGEHRRLQTQAEIDIVSAQITAIAGQAAAVPLDSSLVAQFFSGVESTTASTNLLTPASIDESLTLVQFLLDASAGVSISEAVATDAATALQNMLHAVLVTPAAYSAGQPAATADPTAGANVDIQTRMTRIDTLVTRVGLARLASIQCGESALATRPAAVSGYSTNEQWATRNRLFELSSRKLCITATPTISVGHEDAASNNPIIGSTLMGDVLGGPMGGPVATSSISVNPVDSVTTVFYNNLNRPSELPKAVPVDATYPMANLSSPVVSTRVYNSAGSELTFGISFANAGLADTYVQRGPWTYEDATTTTTLCGYFKAATNSWEECDVVSSDIIGTTCRCPVTTLVATMRSASECISNTNCFTCLSNTKCGWCPGYAERFSGQVAGAPGYCFEGNLQAEFFPGTCGSTPWGDRQAVAVATEVNAWSYDSCPCEAYFSCGDCMLDNDPYNGPAKTKRACGYCPESNECRAATDTASCTDWYIDFVVGMQTGTKLGVTPADGTDWEEVAVMYDPYPGNCPLNCSISWGVANGYSIPGCVNGECQDYVNCVCEPGYWSLDCSRMCPGGANNPCTGNGQCDAGATGSGQCFCNTGYGGADCQDCDTGHWGAACVSECRGGGNTPCSGNGICSSGEAGTGECTCFRGYYGQDCSSFCPGARDVPQRICAANGNCADGPTGNGQCTCWDGFFGLGCAGLCPRRALNPVNGLVELDAQGDPSGPICSGPTRGTCLDGSTGSGACNCLPSFYRADCSGQCPGSSLSGNESCTGRGVCSDGSTGTGLCSCLNGYRGLRCEQLPVRVRVAMKLDVSSSEWELYGLKAMLYAGLADALGVGVDVLLPITVLVGDDDMTVYMEVLSKGFDFATHVRARLNEKTAADLINVIRLPIISFESDTHVGLEWPCGGVLAYGLADTAHKGNPPPVPPLVDGSSGGRCLAGSACVVASGHPGAGAAYVEPTFYCHARGSCNATMGTCVCDIGFAGTDCDTVLSEATKPPIQITAEEVVTWLSQWWWVMLVVICTVGFIGWQIIQRRKRWAEQIREMRTKPVGLEAAEARHWMSLRRMATGRNAADAFIVGPGGQTTGPAARNVWDISLRAASPDEDDPRPQSAGLGTGWLSAWPSSGGV